MELGDMGSGCEEGDCGPASGFPEDCADECQWEEPMFGHVELVCVTVVCVPLMLLGLLGNMLTILVVWLRPHMRSSTYLYLSSMAVSDLLILLLLPLDLYKLWRPRPWPLGDLACKLTMFLSECCTFSTILHITFLSLERYLAVCWPITAKTLVTRHRTKVLIGCLWLGAAVSAAPVLVIVGVEEVGGVEGWRGDEGWMWGDEGLDEVLLKGERRGGGGEMTLTEGTGGAKWTGERGRDWDEGGEMAWASWGEKMEGRDGGGEMKGRGIQKQTGEEEMGVKTEGRSGEEHEGGRRGHEEEKEERTEERRRGGRIEEDKSECRCTDYGVSSGLLSAMMILSNLYFLVPLSILGMVYSLIGRTLWLRPQSSVRDQTHRHTVKMLGVIVLVFVLCWLPFHVGRTLFSLSLGSSVDGSDAHEDTRTDTQAHADADNNTRTHAYADPTVASRASGPSTRRNSDTGSHATHTATDARPKARTRTHEVPTRAECVDTRLDEDARAHRHASDTLSQTRTQAHSGDVSAHGITRVGAHGAKPSDAQTGAHARTRDYSRADAKTRAANAHRARTGTRGSVDTRARGARADAQGPEHPDAHDAARRSGASYAGTRGGEHRAGANATTDGDARANDTRASWRADADAYAMYYLSQYFNLVSSVLFYLSAAVNPLLYNLMSARYRRAVHGLVRSRRTRARSRCSSQPRQFTTHHSSTTV